MKQPKLRVIHVPLDIWEWAGVVLVGGTSNQGDAWVRKFTSIDADRNTQTARGWALIAADHPWVIWLPSLKDKAVLAHEAFHVAASVLRLRGATLNEGSEEAYAYTIGQIVKTVLRNS